MPSQSNKTGPASKKRYWIELAQIYINSRSNPIYRGMARVYKQRKSRKLWTLRSTGKHEQDIWPIKDQALWHMSFDMLPWEFHINQDKFTSAFFTSWSMMVRMKKPRKRYNEYQFQKLRNSLADHVRELSAKNGNLKFIHPVR